MSVSPPVSPAKRLSLAAQTTSRSFADMAARLSPKLGKRVSVLHEALFPDAERRALDAALDAALEADGPRHLEDDAELREEVATLSTQLYELKIVNEALHTEVTDLCNLVHCLRGDLVASQAAERELRAAPEGALWDVQIEGCNAWDQPRGQVVSAMPAVAQRRASEPAGSSLLGGAALKSAAPCDASLTMD